VFSLTDVTQFSARYAVRFRGVDRFAEAEIHPLGTGDEDGPDAAHQGHHHIGTAGAGLKSSSIDLGEPLNPVLFADYPQFWFETLRTLGQTSCGGADIGGVITTAQNIVAGDNDSSHDQWLATADGIATEAETQLAAQHRTSARDALMRTSNYYRAAEFFLHGDPTDPRINHAYRRATQCFQNAAAPASSPPTP